MAPTFSILPEKLVAVASKDLLPPPLWIKTLYFFRAIGFDSSSLDCNLSINLQRYVGFFAGEKMLKYTAVTSKSWAGSSCEFAPKPLNHGFSSAAW